MSHDNQTPHVDYCRRETEIVTLTLDMKVVKQQLTALVQSQQLIEHALLGTLTDTERKGLLEEHHEHRCALFGDKKRPGDKGLVGEVHDIKRTVNKSEWFARGMAAAFGLIGSGIAFVGIKGLAAVAAFLGGHKQ